MIEELTIVKQRNRFDCMAAALAMILDTDIEYAYEQIGHDGTDGKGGYRPTRMRDFIKIAAQHGVFLGSHFVPLPLDAGYQTDIGLSGPALLIVQGANDPHAVCFDGRVVLDPSPGRIGTYDLDDYKILQWWPIRQIS